MGRKAQPARARGGHEAKVVGGRARDGAPSVAAEARAVPEAAASALVKVLSVIVGRRARIRPRCVSREMAPMLHRTVPGVWRGPAARPGSGRVARAGLSKPAEALAYRGPRHPAGPGHAAGSWPAAPRGRAARKARLGPTRTGPRPTQGVTSLAGQAQRRPRSDRVHPQSVAGNEAVHSRRSCPAARRLRCTGARVPCRNRDPRAEPSTPLPGLEFQPWPGPDRALDGSGPLAERPAPEVR